MFKKSLVMCGLCLVALAHSAVGQTVPAADSANFWTIGDIKLHHFSAGSGQKVLIVHGGPGYPGTEPWPGLASLTDRYEFVYYDQRGCGKSTRPIEKFNSPDFMVNMNTLIEKLGLDRQLADIDSIRQILGDEKITLIGHSFGGYITTMYALKYPQNVRAIILVAPAGVIVMPPPPEFDYFNKMKELLPDSLKPGYEDFQKQYFDFSSIFSKSESDLVALNNEAALYYKSAADKSGFILPGTFDPQASGGWMTVGLYMSMGMSYDLRPKLKEFNFPVLVLHGARDFQPEGVGRMYSDNIPGARFQVIDGAGHFMFHDKPAEFGKAIGEFLDGLKK